MERRAEIIVVGDEIVSGVVQDENGGWLAACLAELGIETQRICIVGNSVEMAGQQVAASLVRNPEVLITSGGRGPEEKDITLPAVAMACGRKLVESEDALGLIEAAHARLKANGTEESPPEEQRRMMALMPESAAALPNLIGATPGVLFEAGSTLVVCLPGSPDELRAMWDSVVAETIQYRQPVKTTDRL